MNSVLVLKTEITSTTVEFISDYLKNEKSKTVAICNANTLVRSYRNSDIQEKINSFDDKVDVKTRTIEQLSLELQADSMRL